MNLNVNVNLELRQSHAQLHMHHRLTWYIIIATIYKPSHELINWWVMAHDPCDPSEFRDPFDPWPLTHRPIPCSVPHTRMWANAQRDGRPAEYRWRPLFNAAKFGWRPLLQCRAVTLPRRETRWNLQWCHKLANRSQPLGRSSPYYKNMWRR